MLATSVKNEDLWECNVDCHAEHVECSGQGAGSEDKTDEMRRINFSIPTWFEDLFEYTEPGPAGVNICLSTHLFHVGFLFSPYS